MAEVTQLSRYYNVAGSKRSVLYRISGGNGDTLTTGLKSINQVNVEPNATNSPTASESGGVVTFASGGAFANVGIEVIGN